MILNAIISIISAFIGGSLTLIGVIITIHFENKKKKEELIIANKPLFYAINPMQAYDYKNAIDYNLSAKDNIFLDGKILFIFKNTDKAIMIINYLSINGKKYYPINGNVVDKNTTFNLIIHSLCDPLDNEKNEIILSVNDSLNNIYLYNLDYSVVDKTIISCHEMKNDK